MPDQHKITTPTALPCLRANNTVTAVAAVTIGASSIILAFFSLYLVTILHWQGPFRDLWEFVPFIEQQFHGQWSLDYLLDPYGGAHRIFLPKLFFFIDFYWLQGRNLLTTSTALICQSLYLLIIYRVVRGEKDISAREKILLTGSFGMALFSTTQVNNFLYAMDVQWYMSNALGLASMTALLRSPTTSNICLVMLLGIAAAMCNFTGLMALPVAALSLAICSHSNGQYNRKIRWLTYLLVLIVCWLYMHHDKNAQHVVVAALKLSDNWITRAYIMQDTLHKMFGYTLRYLASPLSRDWPAAGSTLAFFSLVAVCFYWLLYWRGKTLSAFQRLSLYIATYIIISAVATAFGRFIYTNQAVTERYQTLVLPYLPAIAGLVWQDIRHTRFNSLAPAIFTLLMLWHLLPAQLKSAHDMSILADRVNQAHTAARAGVLEPAYINSTLSYPLIKNRINSVKDNDTFLREYQLGYFQHLQEFRLDNTVQIEATLPVCDGNAHLTRDTERQTLLVDGSLLYLGNVLPDMALIQEQKVIGLGTLLRPDDSLLPLAAQPAEQSRFRAFARLDKIEAAYALLIIGIQDHKAVCLFPLAKSSS
ncbi:MAG TPA: hypothetical protein PLF22_10430 [Pseudomonadales bacterium]|nr:hypothetical protein [Pseudomonadales bacterium]